MENVMSDETKMASKVLIWCLLFAVALLIFCTWEPL